MSERSDWIAELRPRVAALDLPPAREAELIEELSQHLDDRRRELVNAGVPSAEARRQAFDELTAHGTLADDFRHVRLARSVERLQPGAPSRRLLADLWQDLAYAVRVLLRQPGFTAAAVLTLALGIGANTAIFSLANATLFQRLPVRDRDHVVYLWNGSVRSVFSYPAYAALRDGTHTLDGIAAWGGISASLNADGVTDLVSGVIVTGNFFDVLGVMAERGRLLSTQDDQRPGAHPVAVISHRLWQTRFGARTDIVGHDVLMNGHVFTIVGVARPEFGGPEIGTVRDVYTPMMMQAVMRPPRAGYSGDMDPDLLRRATNGWLFGVGRLKPGAAAEQAGAELSTLATNFVHALNPALPARRIAVVPVDDGDPQQREQMRSVALLLGGVVAAVLLIACANVANLLLSRATARRRELAVRLAIGAHRGRLVRQLLTESLVLSCAGGFVGVALAWLLVAAFRAVPPPAGALPIAIDFVLDNRVFAFSFLLSLVTGVVFGLAPALGASRPVLVPALKDSSFPADSRSRRFGVKKLLVVIELALALPLLVAAGLFVRSLKAQQAIDPGLDAHQLISSPLSINLLRYTRDQGRDFYQRTTARMRALPGVESATVARVAVLTGGGRTLSFLVEGRTGPDNQFRSEGGGLPSPDLESVSANVVGPDFFRTLGIPLVEGRDFSSADTAEAPRVVIISETTARLHFPGVEAIGKRVSFDGAPGPWVEIVGVARDSKYGTLDETARPVVYMPLSQNHETGMTLYVRTYAPPASLVPAVRREIQALEPNLPIPAIQTMDETIGTSLYVARMGAVLISAFGGLALLLSAIGVYGVLAFSISRRTREMGIRFALGADRGAVVALVVREGLTLAAIGVALGLGIALLAARSLSGFLYGVSATDAATFVAVTTTLTCVSIGACVVPARRAGNVSPIVALRYD